MLRTTILEELTEQRWTLQGRLSGPWVAHLKSNWQKSSCKSGKRKCVVDVSGVTFVDLEGERVTRNDDERWRGVHRLRRVHKARVGNARETPPALDSQIDGLFLAAVHCATFAFL